MRLTTSHLLLLIGLAAMACASLFAADNDGTWLLFAAYPLVFLTRWGRSTARWFPVVLALVVVATSAAGVRPGGDFIMAAIASLFILAMSPALAWRRDGRTHWLALAVAALSVLMMASVVATHWPLRLAFLASRRDFDLFAARLRLGYAMTEPQRIGRFVIRKAEMKNGRPCLWTDTDPNGYDGFVRNPPRAPDGSLQGSSNMAFNLWSAVWFDDDWAFISED